MLEGKRIAIDAYSRMTLVENSIELSTHGNGKISEWSFTIKVFLSLFLNERTDKEDFCFKNKV